MKLHKGINQTEIAVRYYERKGKNISREQAQKNFNLLRNPDITANVIWLYAGGAKQNKTINLHKILLKARKLG